MKEMRDFGSYFNIIRHFCWIFPIRPSLVANAKYCVLPMVLFYVLLTTHWVFLKIAMSKI